MKPVINMFVLLLIVTSLSSQQGKNEIIVKNNPPFLVGPITLQDLKSASYKPWFENSYRTYTIDSTVIASIQSELTKYHILLFMGTWCGDSQREVPRIIKILEAAEFPMTQLKIIGLDRRKNYYKKSPGGEEWGLNILRVPTVLFLKEGKEINRIIERPNISLEEDIKAIITKMPYTPQLAKSVHFD